MDRNQQPSLNSAGWSMPSPAVYGQQQRSSQASSGHSMSGLSHSQQPGNQRQRYDYPAKIPHHPGMQVPTEPPFRPQFVETEAESKQRFEIECEFVQSLANPHYLNCEFVAWQLQCPG